MLAVGAALGLAEGLGEYLVGAGLLAELGEETVIAAETAEGALANITPAVTFTEGEGFEGGEEIARAVNRQRWREAYEAGGRNRPGNPNTVAGRIRDRMPKPSRLRLDSAVEATEESSEKLTNEVQTQTPKNWKRKGKDQAPPVEVEVISKVVKLKQAPSKRKPKKPVKV